jgi:DNA-binding transcriptional LysR family regulator
MELRHFEQIVAICQAGGFSGAARVLRISQPTLSKSIARLERRLSVKLFDRSTGTAHPTAYGEFIAERAEALLSSVAALEKDLQHLVRGDATRIRIGVGPAPRIKPLPDLVRRMSEAYPQLQIVTEQDAAPALVVGLLKGRYDIVLVHHEVAEPHGDLIRVRVLQDRHVAAVRPGHPVIGAAPLTPEDLLKHPIAATHFPPRLRQWLGPVSAEARANLKAFVSDDYTLIKKRIVEAPFVGLAPRFVFEPEFARGELVELPVACDLIYECWLLTTADRWRTPLIKAVADCSREPRNAARVSA